MRETKAALRQRLDAERRKLTPQEHRERSEAVCRHLAACPVWSRDGSGGITVFAFVPFRAEVNIMPFIERLWQNGTRVLLPRVERDSGRMKLYYTHSRNELVPGRWGLLEPDERLETWNGAERIDAVIVPGLAFDRKGGRIGYGAGYYDRFFAELKTDCDRNRIPFPVRLAPAFRFQIVPEVPMDPHDWRVSALITEDGWIPCERPEEKG